MSSESNEAEVERRRKRLRSEYGDPAVEETETVELEPTAFADHVESAREGYIGGGYAFTARRPEQAPPLTESMPEEAADERDRVLLVLPRGGDAWSVPGGGLEGYDPDGEDRGETYEQAAVREVDEETGIACDVTDLYGLRRLTVVSEATDDDRSVHLLYVFFEGEYVDGSIRPQGGEVDGAAWFAELPERLHRSVEPWAPSWEP